ncbi:MAG: type II toxin-antitoxin system VapC family toxin [Pseudomonadota bacterium]|nr:type II toxin-antitoxin system VapC family toxin [Pseudomonadota bacterium]
MRLLIDTHILLWAAVDDPKLRGSSRAAFLDPRHDLVVSAVTLWEIGIKYALGKLPLPVPPRDFFAREIADRGYAVLDLRREHAERAAELPYLDREHRDPFDRMLVAQALVEGLPLLSVDGKFNAYASLGLRLLR